MQLQLGQKWQLRITIETDFLLGDEQIVLRLEVLQSSENLSDYRVRVNRYDQFRVQPVPLLQVGDDIASKVADCEFLVVDPQFDVFQISATSPNAALDKALAKIESQLFL